jgi:hypothetical protein
MAVPRISSAPTVEDVPELKQLERKRREWALLERLATGHTSDGFAMYAECGSCHASVQGWRDHVREVVDLDAQGDDGPSVRLAYTSACSVCGGSVVEVFAEPRRPSSRHRR